MLYMETWKLKNVIFRKFIGKNFIFQKFIGKTSFFQSFQIGNFIFLCCALKHNYMSTMFSYHSGRTDYFLFGFFLWKFGNFLLPLTSNMIVVSLYLWWNFIVYMELTTCFNVKKTSSGKPIPLDDIYDGTF